MAGWQVEEAQARLITEPQEWGDPEQLIAVSAALRFLTEDWTDRFTDSDNDDYAPKLFVTLNRRDAPAPSSNYDSILFETIKKAKKGLIRVATKSDSWRGKAPLTTNDIDLRLTAYDLADISNQYINSELELPYPKTTPLEVVVVDETSVGAPRPNITVAHAYVSEDDHVATLTMHAAGTFQFGSAEELLEVYRDRQDWAKHLTTVKDAAPFKVAVPEIRFEILDDTGFMLSDGSCRFSGHIPVDSKGMVPRRQPSWVCRHIIDVGDLPGNPNRVVVRVTDSDR